MDNYDKSFDALIEALTIKKSFEPAHSPPVGGYHHKMRWHNWRWPADGVDIVYRNKEGKAHRIYGPAYISKNYEIEIWYKDGKYHREGGPAIQHKNNLLWYYEGNLHRLDGPAIINGGPKQFWIEGRKYSPKEYKKEIMRRRRKGLIK
jgi:hypothetical protein